VLFGAQVVEPGGVVRRPALGGDQDDTVAVSQVEKRCRPRLTAASADRLEQADLLSHGDVDPPA
jgi:hypothetical protein